MMYMNLLAGKAGIYIILKIGCSSYQEKPLKMERFSFWVAGAPLQCARPVHRWGQPLSHAGFQSVIVSLQAAPWNRS